MYTLSGQKGKTGDNVPINVVSWKMEYSGINFASPDIKLFKL